MALTKEQKKEVIDKVSSLLENSKMTVVAEYKGTGVKQMQTLRREAKGNSTTISVLKNRLVIKAIQGSDKLKNTEASELRGQLLYAFNPEDEVAPAQTLANFAKKNPSIVFVGAISADGQFLSADEVKALATLPSKPQLIAEVVATLASPLNDTVGALVGNLHGLLDAVEAKASA